ncbi:hypothetical protein ABIB51_002176 [Arthrobacter sp. UYCu712]
MSLSAKSASTPPRRKSARDQNPNVSNAGSTRYLMCR